MVSHICHAAVSCLCLQLVLLVWHKHPAQPLQHVCQLHPLASGHHRGYPEAGGSAGQVGRMVATPRSKQALTQSQQIQGHCESDAAVSCADSKRVHAVCCFPLESHNPQPTTGHYVDGTFSCADSKAQRTASAPPSPSL